MLKAFKFRLYPTNEQSVLLNKHIGSSRFVYNLALECKQMAWAGSMVNLNCFDLINQLPDLKKECAWLKEVNAQSLQQPIRNLDNAFTRFFKGQSDFPKFKKKSNGGSFNIPQHVSISKSKLIIPKFREGISLLLHRRIKGDIRQATISATPTGKYFVSILCETGEEVKLKAKIEESTSVGIDLGIKTFLVSSDGEFFENPKCLRESLFKLKYIQRKYSKNKGKRTRYKLAKIHEKIANQRRDFLHKTSSKLISDNQTICIEDLNIKGMLANHKIALSISDASWGMFTEMLKYKAEWQGKNILKIGRFDPSSKTCSKCGNINKQLTLKDRVWTCVNCKSVLDRDHNAAINIKNFALKNNLSVGRRLKNRKELPTLVGVLTSEASSLLGNG